MSRIRITDGKGFGMFFANGWGISVQFGYGNYCENKERRDESWPENFSANNRKLGAEGSSDAEVAVFNPSGRMVKLPGFMFDDPEYADIVSGWNSPDKVLQLMNWVAAQEKA